MSRRIGRRELLWGAGGGGLGLLAYHNYAATAPAPPGSPPQQGSVSYAPSGEDLIAGYLLQMIRVRDVTYLDIGAYKSPSTTPTSSTNRASGVSSSSRTWTWPAP